VKEILGREAALVAAPILVEFLIRATSEGVPRGRAEEDLSRYLEVLGPPAAVDRDAAERAWMLRAAAIARLPIVLCLIAGCAAARGATLVHRDPHFSSIPLDRLDQLVLSDG
jgi:predicted nucleic acid-binding protein